MKRSLLIAATLVTLALQRTFASVGKYSRIRTRASSLNHEFLFKASFTVNDEPCVANFRRFVRIDIFLLQIQRALE
jgi:hypothetical protein